MVTLKGPVRSDDEKRSIVGKAVAMRERSRQSVGSDVDCRRFEVNDQFIKEQYDVSKDKAVFGIFSTVARWSTQSMH